VYGVNLHVDRVHFFLQLLVLSLQKPILRLLDRCFLADLFEQVWEYADHFDPVFFGKLEGELLFFLKPDSYLPFLLALDDSVDFGPLFEASHGGWLIVTSIGHKLGLVLQFSLQARDLGTKGRHALILIGPWSLALARFRFALELQLQGLLVLGQLLLLQADVGLDSVQALAVLARIPIQESLLLRRELMILDLAAPLRSLRHVQG